MNRGEFHSLLGEPNAITVEQAQSLKSVIDQYPFFQTARLLYLKGLSNSGDLSFHGELSGTSAYAADRKKLYNLVTESEEAVNTPVLEVEEKEVEQPVEKTGETSSGAIPESVKELMDSDDVLDQQILASAFSAGAVYNIEGVEVPDQEDTRSTIQELAESIQPEPAHVPKPRAKASLLDWLEPENEQVTEQREKFDKLFEAFEKKDQERLEEKSEFFSAEELGKKSLEESDEKLVTETLADILAQQGKFEEALNIYERLVGKNPEKSLYFAARIKKMRSQIKDLK